MAHLDRAVGHRVGACRPGTISPAANTWIWNLLSVASATTLGEDFGGAIDRVERLREARRQAPFDLGRRLRDGGRRDWRSRRAPAGGLQKFTALHNIFLPWCGVRGQCSMFPPDSAASLRRGRLVQLRFLLSVEIQQYKAAPRSLRTKKAPKDTSGGHPERVRLDGAAQRARAVRIMKVSIGVFGDLPPQILVVAEPPASFPDLLEVRVLGRDFGIEFVGRLQAGFHHVLRERAEAARRRRPAA